MTIPPESVLFITLDSCRLDTFQAADAPALKATGPVHPAIAPSHFTYGSHSAMFVGFTPHASYGAVPLLNPKFAKIFKLEGAGHPGKGPEAFRLRGANIIEGFAAAGYATIGTGAVGWFDPATPTGRHLTDPFHEFLFDSSGSARQLSWVEDRLANQADRPVFLFVNIGETHVPYWHEGAEWPADDNPCMPFQTADRREECAYRQRRCLEYVDGRLAPLLRRFEHATVLICADHGDAWGEDGVWEHGVPHPMALSVPLVLRVRGQPV